MPNQKIYDIIGIGIGPFNLGLAVIVASVPELNCLFIDQNEEFSWHAGMMIPGARLQVPFYADLVTLADPCSRFSFLSFLKAKQRLFRFAIQENYFIRRTEYNEYCRWVIDQLSSLQFGTICQKIEKDSHFYKVTTSKGTYMAQNIVLGTGTTPFIPDLGQAKTDAANLFHSAYYMQNKERIHSKASVTIVGSGQSAAEIFYDLMQSYEGNLSWFTRSERFFPMDYSKLTLEMSTPDYIDHFFSTPERLRPAKLKSQDCLYKGINESLIAAIYDMLVEKDSDRISLNANCELHKITGNYTLKFQHKDLQQSFDHATDAVILATGYMQLMPDCIKPLRPHLLLDADGFYKAKRNYSVDEENSIFIQNGEHATHGFNASDLSLGPYRNAIILNAILGHEHFHIERNVTFQNFGIPPVANKSKSFDE
jgi:lysine N6-hydroxylase